MRQSLARPLFDLCSERHSTDRGGVAGTTCGKLLVRIPVSLLLT